MTVHILEPDNHVFSLNRLAAMIGFHQLGEEVQLFTEEKFDALPLVSGDIVVGGVGYAQRGMRRLGLTVPILESVPLKLLPFAGRRLWRSTMAEVRARVEAGDALFAKPTPTRLKLFTGQVFSSFHDLIGTAHIADDEILDCAETIAPVSEYRAFILRGELEGLRHYKGDPLVLPDAEVIRKSISVWDDKPSGCALDFGVTDEGRTVVVEANDGYAVGAYGLHPVPYAKMIAARWEEIRREEPNADPTTP